MNKDIKLDTLFTNKAYVVQVRYRIGNQFSAWSPALNFTTISDDGKPKVPSKPIVKDYLGTLIVAWDGKAFDDSVMDKDFKWIEVHTGDDPSFTPSRLSLYTTMTGAFPQETAISGLPFKVLRYVKFVAVDVAENKSDPSEVASGTPKKVTGDALDNLAVEIANINFNARDIGATFAYYQDEEPTEGMQNGDVWYDTGDGNHQYVYNSGEWKSVRDLSNGSSIDSEARDLANQALTAANGKNRITYSTSTPPSNQNVGGRVGDIWFRRDATIGNIIAQYEWTGSAWVARQMDNQVIANLDAGKITAGTISADRIGARTITTDKIIIGDTTNIIVDPNLSTTTSFNYISPQTTRVISTDSSVPTGAPAEYVAKVQCRTSTTNLTYQSGIPLGIIVSPGDAYYLECWLRASSDANTNFGLTLLTTDVAGGNQRNTTDVFAIPANYQTWTKYVGIVRVPENHFKANFNISVLSATGAMGSWFATGFKFRKAVETTTIADGAITTSKIFANSLNADRLTAGSITTDKIGANQITGAKIAAGAITAGSAIIGNAAIDTSQIGSLEAGKITTGILNSVLTVSGRIQTSTSYPSVDISSAGLTLYNASATPTVNLNGLNGTASFTGDMVAKTWFSRNYINGGGYIQIGSSNLNEDANDEVRFFVSNGAVALRSPTAFPGRFRISLRDSTFNTRVIDFDVAKGILANRFTMGDQFGTYPYMESYYSGSSGTWIRTVLEGGYNLYFGSVENSHSWIANDKVGIALLGSNLNQINFRNSSNTAYANIQANTAYFSALYVNGVQITGNGGSSGTPNYANNAGYATYAGQPYNSEWNVSLRVNTTHMVASGNIDVAGTIYYGYLQSRGSVPEAKTNISSLNMDMYPVLENAEPKIWKWKEVSRNTETKELTIGEDTDETGLGFMVTDLPAWMSLNAENPMEADTYDLHAMVTGLWQACRQLVGDVKLLKQELLEYKNTEKG